MSTSRELPLREVAVTDLLNRVQGYHYHTGNMSHKDSAAFLRGVMYAQHMLIVAMLAKLEALGQPVTQADLAPPQYGNFPLSFCSTTKSSWENTNA